MKKKLTITIEEKVKKQAKQYAKKKGTTISKIVEQFLSAISQQEEDPIQQLGENPLSAGISDASEKHDRYLYTPDR